MIKRLVMVIVVLALMFGGIFGWKHYMAGINAALMSQPPPPATVASTEVTLESWEPYLTAVGSVVATQNVYITTEVAGQIQKILFESGQSVEKGDLILQLDDSVAKAELTGLIARGELAKLQFDRNARLIKDRSVSQSEYDRLQAELEREKIQARKAQFKSQQVIDLAQVKLTAAEREKFSAKLTGRLGRRPPSVSS